MARRIIWTSRAEGLFVNILEFYIQRNKSKIYSRKLNAEIKKTINLLIKNPFLGRRTEIESISVLIKGNYKIFYKIENELIIVLLV